MSTATVRSPLDPADSATPSARDSRSVPSGRDEAHALTADMRALVEQHQWLVHRVAAHWRPRCRTTLDYADLVQVGHLGLMEAARRHDSRRPETFIAFARERIRGAICDALRSHDPLSRGRRQAVRRLEHATRELASLVGREPEEVQVQAALGWSPHQLESAKQDRAALKAGLCTTLSDLTEDGAEPSDPRWDDAFRSVLRDELRREVADAIAKLPEKDRMVIALSYGEELTMKEIGVVMGVSESRVSQIHSRAVLRLRCILERAGLES